MSDYTHYIQKENAALPQNLESDFGRILYSKCEGLNTKGKRKNVYVEDYSDSDTLRVWQNENSVTREATKITLTLYFIGNETERMKSFDALYQYINNGRFYYWDTARKKKAYCILQDEFKPSEELWYGSTPYIATNITLQNLWGECKDCNDNGVIL